MMRQLTPRTDLDKDTTSILQWIAAEYNYVDQELRDLRSLRETMDRLKSTKRDLAASLMQGRAEEAKAVGQRDARMIELLLDRFERHFRYASSSQARLQEYEKRLERDILKLSRSAPERFVQYQDFQRKLKLAGNQLLIGMSRYQGEIRNHLDLLKKEISLLATALQKGDTEDRLQQREALIDQQIDNVYKKISEMLTWLAGLTGTVQGVAAVERKSERVS